MKVILWLPEHEYMGRPTGGYPIAIPQAWQSRPAHEVLSLMVAAIYADGPVVVDLGGGILMALPPEASKRARIAVTPDDSPGIKLTDIRTVGGKQ